VDVVGHDDPGVEEMIEVANLLTILKGIFDHAGYASVL
jgi:predicted MarR family transcription regulator